MKRQRSDVRTQINSSLHRINELIKGVENNIIVANMKVSAALLWLLLFCPPL